MSESGAVPERVVGKRAPVSVRQQRILAVTGLLYFAFVAWQVSRGRWSSVVVFAFWAVYLGVILLRRPTVVDRDGIRRPLRVRGSVVWSGVDRVAAPQVGIGRVRLWMKSGKTVTLDDVGVDQSAAVAAIGGVTLGFPPQPAPPPRPRQPTDRDTDADVDRRAQALAERGKQLDAEYRRIQGRNRPAREDGGPPSS